MELNCKISNPSTYTFDKLYCQEDNYRNNICLSEASERKGDTIQDDNNNNNNNKITDVLTMIMKENMQHLEMFKAKHFPASYHCRAENVIKIFFGWSVGVNIKELSEYLDISQEVARHFYFLSTLYAKRYIKEHIEEWRIGGPGNVVLLDIYPDGCSKFRFRTNDTRSSVLCIAEAKSIPQKFWFQILNHAENDQRNEEILKVVSSIVRTGSILVIDLDSTAISDVTYNKLKANYQIVVDLELLGRHNTESQTLLQNLQTIWKPALDICEFGNYQSDMMSYYTSYLWNQRFGNDNLSMLLNQF